MAYEADCISEKRYLPQMILDALTGELFNMNSVRLSLANASQAGGNINTVMR
jgi:hypothetical protein